MNVIPIFLLYMFGKMGGAKSFWPAQSDPPPRRAHKPHPKGPRAQMKVGPVTTIKHGKPATNTESHIPDSPAHADTPAPHGKHFTSLDFSHAPHHDADTTTPIEKIHHDAPAPQHAASHVEQHQTSEPPAGVYPVAHLQKILVALGWRGHGTTKGPLTSDLTDGDFGPVTRDDWAQSANKRSLDPTFVRIDGQHAHVDPQTYATLRSVAKQMSPGAVVGSRRRALRIP